MLSNVKTYQLETASQRFPSQNLPLCCTQFVYLQKDHFHFTKGSLVAAMFVYIHMKCSDFTNVMVWSFL